MSMNNNERRILERAEVQGVTQGKAGEEQLIEGLLEEGWLISLSGGYEITPEGVEALNMKRENKPVPSKPKPPKQPKKMPAPAAAAVKIDPNIEQIKHLLDMVQTNRVAAEGWREIAEKRAVLLDQQAGQIESLRRSLDDLNAYIDSLAGVQPKRLTRQQAKQTA